MINFVFCLFNYGTWNFNLIHFERRNYRRGATARRVPSYPSHAQCVLGYQELRRACADSARHHAQLEHWPRASPVRGHCLRVHTLPSRFYWNQKGQARPELPSAAYTGHGHRSFVQRLLWNIASTSRPTWRWAVARGMARRASTYYNPVWVRRATLSCAIIPVYYTWTQAWSRSLSTSTAARSSVSTRYVTDGPSLNLTLI